MHFSPFVEGAINTSFQLLRYFLTLLLFIRYLFVSVLKENWIIIIIIIIIVIIIIIIIIIII